MDSEQTTTPQEKPTLGQLWQDIKKHKKLYIIMLPVSFFFAAFITLSIPNYYTCTVKLSPELSNRSTSTSSLASLASSFGVKLGSALGNSSEALFPTLYPDLMASIDFKVSLFKVKVRPEDSNQEYSYYDYKKNIEKSPWWSKINKAIFAIFSQDDSEDMNLNPRRLTKEQSSMARAIEKYISCDVNKKTMVITISAIDNDPQVCATMADSAMVLLQRFITDYRTSKARVDLEYNKKMLSEAKINYEKASRAYAQYADGNLHTFQEKIRQKLSELETEMQLQRAAYQQVVAQYQQAEMKLQEDTPAFAVIQASTIPAKKTGPKRSIGCIFIVFMVFLVISIYVLYKENDLKPFLGL